MKKFISIVFFFIIIIIVSKLLSNYLTYEGLEQLENEFYVTIIDNNTNQSEEITIDEYIYGVINYYYQFNLSEEVLKAISICARSLSYYNYSHRNEIPHPSYDLCANSKNEECCFGYLKNKNYTFPYDTSISLLDRASRDNTIKNIISKTKNLVIFYDEKIIRPYIFYTSSGFTRDGSEMLKFNNDYLKTVESIDIEYLNFSKREDIYENNLFVSMLKDKYEDIIIDPLNLKKEIMIISYYESGCVKNIRLGNKIISFDELKNLFFITSPSIEISFNNNSVIIVQYGYGLGLGMPIFGCEYLARNGNNYEQIIKYYFSNVNIDFFETK